MITRDCNGNLPMPGPSEWLEWLESDDARFRSSAVVGLSARLALEVHEDRNHGPLTAYGLASVAAGNALVLADPEHWNHAMVMARCEQLAGAPASPSSRAAISPDSTEET